MLHNLGGKIYNKTIGNSFDDFLVEEGISEEVEERAIKKIITYQLLEAIE